MSWFHRHKWQLMDIWNHLVYSISKWAYRCTECNDHKVTERDGHWTIAKHTTDTEVTELRKMAGLK